jgi:hypothetical protein
MKIIGLALALTFAACGKGTTGDAKLSSSLPPGSTSPAADPTSLVPASPAPAATVPAATASSGQTVTVRLLGVQAAGPVRVRAAALELAVDDRPLLAALSGGELDLGDDQNAWEVTSFVLPADARTVAVRLQLEPAGLIERAGKTQVLDLAGPPLFVVADAALIRARSHLVLELDLARSLVSRGGQVFLLPAVTVRY